MSAERAVFKEIDKLVATKEAFDRQFMEKGKELVALALKEFMDEHPEVKTLKFQGIGFWYCFVDLGQGFTDFTGVEEPKLAGCVKALEVKFNAIKQVLLDLYGSAVEVNITHDGVTIGSMNGGTAHEKSQLAN